MKGLINKEEFLKRFKSLLWRLGMLGLLEIVVFVAANLELFNVPQGMILIISLVLSEVTKQINNRLNSLRRVTTPPIQ